MNYKRTRIYALILSSVFTFYILFWLLKFKITLINDEYTSLDYVYRVIHTGHLYPTPYRFQKPLSMLFALISLKGGPLGFEILNLIFAGISFYYVYLLLEKFFSKRAGLLALILFGLAPDIVGFTLKGVTLVPHLAFTLMAIYYADDFQKSYKGWWKYSIFTLLGGLLRPESWLFALPIPLWLWKHRKEMGYFKFMLAPSIVALGPIIWFGKDYFLNGTIFHSINVMRYEKTIGTGAHFGFFRSFGFLYTYLGRKMSLPFFWFGIFSLIVIILKKGISFLIQPFVIVMFLMVAYAVMIILAGAYPQDRYFFLTGCFLLMYSALVLDWIIGWSLKQSALIKSLGWAFVLVMLGLYTYFSAERFRAVELPGLKRESAIQAQMVEVANFLKMRISEDKTLRVLIPSRRDEQLSWLLRDRPLPEVLTMQEAFYYHAFHNYDIFELKPEWIVYIDDDYQFWRVDLMFQWLAFQDKAEFKGIVVEKEFETEIIRLFSVTYPEGFKPTRPTPPVISIQGG